MQSRLTTVIRPARSIEALHTSAIPYRALAEFDSRSTRPPRRLDPPRRKDPRRRLYRIVPPSRAVRRLTRPASSHQVLPSHRFYRGKLLLVRQFRRICQGGFDVLSCKRRVAHQDFLGTGALRKIVQDYRNRNPRASCTDLTGAYFRFTAQKVLPSGHHFSTTAPVATSHNDENRKSRLNPA